MKKKLFTLLTALVLSIGIGWATDYSYNFTWSMIKSTTVLQNYDNGSVCYTDFYYNPNSNIKPCLRLVWGASSTRTVSNKKFMPNGSYVFQVDPALDAVASGGGDYYSTGYSKWVYNNSRQYSMYYPDNTKHYFTSGNVVVEDGADNKPYVVVTAKGGTSQNSTSNNYTITIGSPKPKSPGTISVDVASGQSAMGTVSGGGYGAGGDEIQISAEGKGDYIFDHWNDNVKDNPRTVVVNGNQTYTAYFVDKNAAAWRAFETAHIQSSNLISINAGVGYYDASFNFEDNILQMIVHDTQGPQQNNYLVFSIKCQTQSYNGILGPIPGDYGAVVPKLYYSGYEAPPYDYWYINNKPAEYVLGRGYDSYYYSSPNYTHFSDHLSLSETNERYLNSSTFHVEEGENGNMFLKIIKPDEGVIITVGHPAPQVTTHKVTFKVEGQKDVVMDVEEGQTPAYTGETPTKASTVDKVYTFSGWKSSIDEQVYATASLPKVGSSDVTYTATFEPSTRQYAITINAATNGTITVMNGNTEVQTGDKVDYNTVLTVTTTPSTNYHFDAWTTGTGYVTPDADGKVTVTSDIKLGVTFAIDTYTLTMDECEGGTYTVKVGEDAPTTATSAGQEIKNIAYGTSVTLTATADEANGYEFVGWEKISAGEEEEEGFEFEAPYRAPMEDGPEDDVEGGSGVYASKDSPFTFTMEGDAEYLAVFAKKGYTLTLTSDPVAGGTATVTSEQKDFYAEGEQVTIEAVKNAGYHFVKWRDEETANPRTITMTGDVTLTAEFAENFRLIDTENQGASWYNEYNNYVEAGEKVSVTYVRTFAKGWSVFSLPFDYTFINKKNNTFRGMVRSIDEVIYDNDGYVEIRFATVSSKIQANTPYILYATETIENPEFDNVMLKAIADGSYSTTLSGEVSGTIDFVNTQYRMPLAENGEEHKDILYINSDNILCYPAPKLGKSINMRAFRGYFKMNAEIKYAPVRLIGEDGEVLEMQQDAEGNLSPVNNETRKYMENGVLYIERNGVRYTAIGERVQ